MPFIRFKRFAWASRIIDSHLRERGISVDPMIEIDSLDGINMLVANGLGVSIVPRRHVDEPFPEGVRVVPFGTPPIVRTIGLIERSDTTKSMLTSALHEELVGMCGDPGVSVKKRRKR